MTETPETLAQRCITVAEAVGDDPERAGDTLREVAAALEAQAAQIAKQTTVIEGYERIYNDAMRALRETVDERDAMAAQIAELKSVMIAAAEEISAHWDAHCDAEGYGPSNLMHRLEQGIPSQYGYTAGRFAELIAERDAQAAQIATMQAREKACATMDEAEKRSLIRALQECCQALGLDAMTTSPAELVKAVSAQAAQIEALRADAERWQKWLPWMRNINRKPYGLAREIDAIDAAMAEKEPK
jgi:hypothetical protein